MNHNFLQTSTLGFKRFLKLDDRTYSQMAVNKVFVYLYANLPYCSPGRDFGRRSNYFRQNFYTLLAGSLHKFIPLKRFFFFRLRGKKSKFVMHLEVQLLLKQGQLFLYPISWLSRLADSTEKINFL